MRSQASTGLPVGERDATGQFTPGTVFARVDTRLRELAEKIRRFEPYSDTGAT